MIAIIIVKFYSSYYNAKQLKLPLKQNPGHTPVVNIIK